jgi:hypothetical protein
MREKDRGWTDIHILRINMETRQTESQDLPAAWQNLGGSAPDKAKYIGLRVFHDGGLQGLGVAGRNV